MKNNAKENHPFIYDRTTGEKIPVNKEIRDAYYGEAARSRMKEQAHGRCVCPQSNVWACDGDCLICEYRRSGDLASLNVPIGEDGEDTLWTCFRLRLRPSRALLQTATCLTAFSPVFGSLTPMRTPSSPCGWTTTTSPTAPLPRPSVGPSAPSPTR